MMNIKPRTCKICGKEFIPNSCRQYYCKQLHYRICPVCGQSYPEPNLDKFKFPPTTCSMKCRTKKREQTSLQKYGITAPGNNPQAREKSKKTMRSRYGVDYAQKSKTIHQKSTDTLMKNYGVDNPQKSKQIQEKTIRTNHAKYGSKSYLNSKQGKKNIEKIMLDKYATTIPLRNKKIKDKWITTNINKYGTTTPLCNAQVKQKTKETLIKRFGTDHPMKSNIIKQQVKDTFIRNYGVDNCSKSQEIIEKIKNSFFQHYGVHSVMEVKEIAARIKETNIKRYGVPYYVMLPNISKSSGRLSKINAEISSKLTQAGIYNQMEYPIENYSYDIYIPQANMLLEIDPTYTHNVIGNHWRLHGIHKYYHLKKTLVAKKHGYRCIHLWDWDIISHFIDMLSVKHRIYDGIVTENICFSEAAQFIQQYGLYDVTQNIPNIAFIGIRYKTKLMTIMGFRQVDFITNAWELVCIENRFNYIVHNSGQLLLDEFIRQYNPSRIISYADFSKTNGESLEALGFKYKKFIPPNKIWSKGRHAIIDGPQIIPEAMMAERWLPVYNCGYKLYEKRIQFSPYELPPIKLRS